MSSVHFVKIRLHNFALLHAKVVSSTNFSDLVFVTVDLENVEDFKDFPGVNEVKPLYMVFRKGFTFKNL